MPLAQTTAINALIPNLHVVIIFIVLLRFSLSWCQNLWRIPIIAAVLDIPGTTGWRSARADRRRA
ncbi:hypothetical protein IQ289_19265 [Burkholderia sp. R-70006]|uniref:hypothetical protein n=1 Tax=Paraburkholderia domus TaxID=2793075 RepID=UPI0019128ED7|nr:hypothetical protein [Paraburkholderia domus]MBK5050538.1 hypothetical protein [Burkholderia sp. R-70006]